MDRPSVAQLLLGVATTILVALVPHDARSAQPFGRIRVGDADSLGFTNLGAHVAAVGAGTPVDTDGDGHLEGPTFDPDRDGTHETAENEPIEFAPDVPPADGMFAVGSDDFDHRSSAERLDTAVSTIGAIDLGSRGSEWTDLGVSTSFPGLASDFPDGDPIRPNNPHFSFDFETTTLPPNGRIYFRMLWADGYTVPLGMELTYRDGSIQSSALDVITLANLGGLIWASAEIPRAKLFENLGSGRQRGRLDVAILVPDEPFFAIDYAEIVLLAECGNGAVDAALEPVEQCDDGNRTPGDGCDEFCHVEVFTCCSGSAVTCNSDAACGGGTCCLGRCDSDGDPNNGCDGIGHACSSETAALGCGGASPICCGSVCGNGYVEPGEECDDGGNASGGCSPDCETEGICTGDPSKPCANDHDCEGFGTCCGDGSVNGAEECDDGNLNEDDTCSNTCTACDSCPPSCVGFSGPNNVTATARKTTLTDRDANLVNEAWRTDMSFYLTLSQLRRFAPDWQPVQMVLRESDGHGGGRNLWASSPIIVPQECLPGQSTCFARRGKPGRILWPYRDRSKTETINPGIKTASFKEGNNAIRSAKFAGKHAAILSPTDNRGTPTKPVFRVRQDVIVGGLCATVELNCSPRGKSQSCVPVTSND